MMITLAAPKRPKQKPEDRFTKGGRDPPKHTIEMSCAHGKKNPITLAAPGPIS